MSDSPDRASGFIEELRRRHVFRVAIAYGVVAFIVLQVAEIAFPALRLPDWTVTLVVVLVMLGFPIALVLAWAFEITPEGVRRTDLTTDARRGRRGFVVAIGALAVLAIGILVLRHSILALGDAEAGEIRRIAVLPLSTYSEDPQQEYFAQALTEALTHELAQIRALHVISRTSASQYIESGKRVTEIAEELGVDAVVEGSVLLTGDRVRITAQLIHARTDRHLWSAEYERDLQDILALQKEVARAIASAVRAQLTPQEERLLAASGPIVPEAYREYVRGRYLWNLRRPDAVREAIEHFERAIEIDPAYALGWAGLADCYVVPAAPFEAATRLPRAKAAAVRALDLDSDLAEAHTTLGYAIMQYDYDWEAAGRHFRRAIDLNPGYATGHQWYAEYLSAVGRMDEAVEAARKAVELDPLSEAILWNLQRTLLFARRYDESITVGRQSQDLEASYKGLNELYLSIALRLKGEDRAALDVLLSPLPDFIEPDLARGLERARERYQDEDWTGFWRAMFEEPMDPEPQNVSMLTFMGRYDDALELADQLYRTHNLGWYVVDLAADPTLDPLREDPRYHRLMEKIGLADRPAVPADA